MKEIISHLYQDKSDGHWVIQSNEEHTAGGQSVHHALPTNSV